MWAWLDSPLPIWGGLVLLGVAWLVTKVILEKMRQEGDGVVLLGEAALSSAEVDRALLAKLDQIAGTVAQLKEKLEEKPDWIAETVDQLEEKLEKKLEETLDRIAETATQQDVDQLGETLDRIAKLVALLEGKREEGLR